MSKPISPRKHLTMEGIRLSYLEHAPANSPDAYPTLFFIHGNSGSAAAWTGQLSAPALGSYRLIAFDLPAHGDSSALAGSDLAYSFPDLGRLIAGAVQHLAGAQPYVLAGLSIGTNIVVESLPYLKPVGVVLIGSCIMGSKLAMDKAFFQGINLEPGFTDVVSEASLDEYAALAAIWTDLKARDVYKESFRMVKDGFRSKMFAAVAEGRLSDETALLEASDVPVLAIYGKEEKVSRPDALEGVSLRLWQGRVHTIAGAGHFAQADQPEACNRLLADFAGEVLMG